MNWWPRVKVRKPPAAPLPKGTRMPWSSTGMGTDQPLQGSPASRPFRGGGSTGAVEITTRESPWGPMRWGQAMWTQPLRPVLSTETAMLGKAWVRKRDPEEPCSKGRNSATRRGFVKRKPRKERATRMASFCVGFVAGYDMRRQAT